MQDRCVLAFCNVPSPLWSLISLSRVTRGSQGGGVYVESGGVANFEGCNIHHNAAGYVCSPSALAYTVPPSPRWNVTCAHDWQYGGGLYIEGAANLTNTNVSSNAAGYVCSPLNLSLSLYPAPN